MWFRKSQTDKDDESVQALQEAKEHLSNVADRSGEVYSIAASLRNLRENNHFAETVVEIMRWG